ncbi:MAG: phosphoribosylformylglycinamidine cyclo-ligase, partial [Armatimonadetes bacterium]|nr:phosphoribosylformylglycinamidine cyclo-ligase [Armatimonadota bacterium]
MSTNGLPPTPDQQGSLTYARAGVRPGREVLGGLLEWVNRTVAFRAGRVGEPLIPNGYFASVLRLTDDLGLAIGTDGVGSKILIAEMLGEYGTIGIDCVAMNVNDVLCVGAEPVALVDYVAVNVAEEQVLREIGRGLHEGARQADVVIPGGELAQLPEMIAGHGPGPAIDLVATCVGVVSPDRLICGQDLDRGDVILGLPSSGVHSNGLTLARRALFDRAGLSVNDRVPGTEERIGQTLLRPTRIYVRAVRALLASGVTVKAMAHITGDGFLNLTRTARPAAFAIDMLPAPPPVFELIRSAGG